MDILVIDDDVVDRERFRREIHAQDSSNVIVEASTAKEGLELYAQRKFDVVLLDYRLPDKNGIDALIELRKNPNDKGTAIIVASTINDMDIALACIRAGAQDFIPKNDITPDRLARAIIQAQERFILENELKKSYEKAKYLAERDTLTGLANRYFFDQSLQLAVSSNRREDEHIGLLLLDLDNFKNVNDSYGHDVGDQMLVAVTDIIQQNLREHDLFARVGGDEFAILLSKAESSTQVMAIANRILESLRSPLLISNIKLKTSVSIGIAIHPQDGRTSDLLFKHADIAMYHSKSLGRDRLSFYESKMFDEYTERLDMEANIHQALSDNEFSLNYQPQFCMADLELQGFEALLRWNHNGYSIMPDQFIGVAEESHQIIEIGRWVIQDALKTLAAWNTGRETKLTMAINLSAVQLGDAQLVQFIQNQLLINDIDPSLVEFELTETILIHDLDSKVEVLTMISDLGCRLALDDFGTGYSSFTHLKRFPIDTIKIDQTIIPVKVENDEDASIIKGIAEMTQGLKLDTVVEGIETEEQMVLCRDLGITRAQGFLLAKPMTVTAIDNEYLFNVGRITSSLIDQLH